jgi:hypothetical protein
MSCCSTFWIRRNAANKYKQQAQVLRINCLHNQVGPYCQTVYAGSAESCIGAT